MKPAFHLVSIVSFGLLLSSCGSTPSKKVENSNITPTPDVTDIINRAEKSTGNQATTLLIDAAEMALEQQSWQLLRNLVKDLPDDGLNNESTVRSALIKSALLQHDNDNSAALGSLTQSDVIFASKKISPKLKADFLLETAQLQAKLGLLPAAISSLLARSEWLDDTQLQTNRLKLWQYLIALNNNQLYALSKHTKDDNLRGWLELAILYRDGDADITQQANSLSSWQQRWSKHEANNPLPGGLQKLQAASKALPKKVLVCLPTSGSLASAGKTIRDGILYAHWEQRNNNLPTPQLEFIDSEPLDAPALLERINESQADVVIGPLNKDKASALAKYHQQLPNTLLLNVINDNEPSDNIISFGLNPEDEASQIADRALLETGPKALVIAPNNSLGDRLESAFIDRWLTLGGTISQQGRYEDARDISNTIKSALNIDKSEMRKRRLALNTGLSLQFEPRRRKDINMATVFGKPQEARSISPLFAFHYAQDIPLYSSSMAYSGQPDATADRDLEGVRFNDIPWLLSPESKVINAPSVRFKRLFAMGIDAYRLHQRFAVMGVNNGMQVQGTTGRLSLNEQRQIVRQLDWGEFRNGLAIPLPSIQ